MVYFTFRSISSRLCWTYFFWCLLGTWTYNVLLVKGESYSRVCEHETLYLRCEEGQFIYVTTAIYGHQGEKTCGPVLKTDCAAANSLQIVQNLCNGKRACEVKAGNDVFGDPCKGTVKYLEMNYTCSEGSCQQYQTPDMYDYTYMPRISTNADYFTFKVRANNDAHIALTRQPYDDEDSSKLVEIVLGGWSNELSGIRGCKQCDEKIEVSTPNLLSPLEDKHFNISFEDGNVQVGLVGEESFMSHRFSTDEFAFNYIGVSTGWGSTGNWTFCNYIPTPTYLGCFIDASDRALPNHLIEDHENMTLEKCWAHCRSFGDQRYAGLQYTYQCFCGSDYDTRSYYTHGPVADSECSLQCSGNSGQYCGAGWRNSVYNLGEPTIRLQGAGNSYTGRIELYHSGTWSSVCDNDWDLTDSHVACRMLGYLGAETFYIDAMYGQGVGNILLTDVQCTGEENNLFECDHRVLYNHSCSHADDVAVKCRQWGHVADMNGSDVEDLDPVFRFLIVLAVLLVFLFIIVSDRRKKLSRYHERHVTFKETFMEMFCRKQLSSPNRNAHSCPPITVSGNVAEQGQDDTLPSYDAAMVDTNSHGGEIDSNLPPYNPDIYDDSAINDPSLPPPPAYDTVVTKSEDYQLPGNKLSI